jgi:alpha-tubulin suppressor-like RCC1 family protein
MELAWRTGLEIRSREGTYRPALMMAAWATGRAPRRGLLMGLNIFGELGDKTTTQRLTPVRVHAGGLRFRQVSAGSGHTCRVTTGGLAYCWGVNFLGQLGDGTTITRRRPVAVAGAS